MNNKKALAGVVFAALPVTLFFPVGVMYALMGVAVVASLLSGSPRPQRALLEKLPLMRPFLLLASWVVLEALLLSAGSERRWSGMLHYFIFGFFLLFVVLHKQRYYLLAKKMLLAGAVYAAIVFTLAKSGMLPDWKIFKNYYVYAGNKSISLGIFMAIAAAWMLNECYRAESRRMMGIYLAAYGCVSASVILFAVTRTGTLLLLVLSALVMLRWMRLGWKPVAVAVVACTALTVAWNSSTVVAERLHRTVDAVIAFSQGKSGSGENNRLQFIEKTSEMIAEKPLLGHGIGSWQQQYPVRAEGLETAFMSTPHNDYLLYTAELGVVGLILLALIHASLLRSALRAPRRSGNALLIVTVALIIGSVFNAILRDWRFGVPFMLMLAIAYREMLAGSDDVAAGQSMTLSPATDEEAAGNEKH